MSGRDDPGLLADSLAMSVQQMIPQLREAGEGARELLRARILGGNLLQQDADTMLYGGRGSGNAHAAYATTIAILAFAPGGVRVAGLCFCAAHPFQRWGEYEVCGACLAEERQPPQTSQPEVAR